MHRCRDFIPTVTGLRHRAQLRVLGTGIWFLGARPHSEKSSRLARGRDAYQPQVWPMSQATSRGFP